MKNLRHPLEPRPLEVVDLRHKAWKERNPKKSREQHIKHQYKLDPQQYSELLAEQNNRCAICSSVFIESKTPHVDHDHRCCKGTKSCGRCVRGVLCRACNTLLGNAKDSVLVLLKAALYLKGKSTRR